MKPVPFIAGRYLFAKKQHNVINIISAISSAGICIGCAALVIILSIYNGFDSLVRTLFESYSADLVITPVKGKVFSPSGAGFDALRADDGVLSFAEVLEENVFLRYDDSHTVATARGVDAVYERVTGIRDYIVEGAFDLRHGQENQAVLGRGVAAELRVRTQFLTPLEVYFPSRTEAVSLLDPMSSLRRQLLYPSGIVAIDKQFDSQYIYVPISALRELLQYTDEVSSIELTLSPELLNASGVASAAFQGKVRELLGEGFAVTDKYQQNKAVYKMMTYEKLAIYAILIFVVIIISCNIFGSLKMLVVEKRDDIGVLRSLGADSRLIKRVFRLQGWLISLLGEAAGILIGLLVCFVQARYGIVKMPGNFIVDAYPVVVQAEDVILVAVSVALIGFLMSCFVKIPSNS